MLERHAPRRDLLYSDFEDRAAMDTRSRLLEEDGDNEDGRPGNLGILWRVLQLLSMELCYYCDTTRWQALAYLMDQLKIFPYVPLLLRCSVHPCSRVRGYACVLLQGLLMHSTERVFKAVQVYALHQGYVLWHMYLSINSKRIPGHHGWYSPGSVRESRILLGMLTDGNNILRSVVEQGCFSAFPPEYASTLNTPPTPEMQRVATHFALRSSAEREWVKQRVFVLYRQANSQGRFARRLNWVEHFKLLDQEIATPRALWNQRMKKELLDSLRNEIILFEEEKALAGVGGGQGGQSNGNYGAFFPSIARGAGTSGSAGRGESASGMSGSSDLGGEVSIGAVDLGVGLGKKLDSGGTDRGIVSAGEESVIWDYENFHVKYKTLERYLKVGVFYVNLLLPLLEPNAVKSDRGTSPELLGYGRDGDEKKGREGATDSGAGLRNNRYQRREHWQRGGNQQARRLVPIAYLPTLITLLFQRMAVEDDPGWKLACLRLVYLLYLHFPAALITMEQMPYLVWLFDPQHTQPVWRDQLLELFFLLLENPENCSRFVQAGGVEHLCYYIAQVMAICPMSVQLSHMLFLLPLVRPAHLKYLFTLPHCPIRTMTVSSQIHTLSDKETNAALSKMSVLTYLDELSPPDVHERALRTGLVLRKERQEERDAAMVQRMLENLDRAEEKALQRRTSALVLKEEGGEAEVKIEGKGQAVKSHREGKHRFRKGC